MGLWLAFVGIAVWLQTRHTDFPPIYDALGYFEKAKNFWERLSVDKLFNPFSLEPVFRPPGTILLSYPFGFDVDYRPFYFRSVFIPVFCFAFALCIAGYSRNLNTKGRWNLAFLAASLTALPLFYYFELAEGFPAPSHWGLVDNFLAGVLALSAAACIMCLRTFSRKWLLAMVLLSSFAILIKPAGFVGMALITASWFFMMILRMRHPREGDPAAGVIKHHFFFGLGLAGIINGIVLVVSLKTHYLGLRSLAVGAQNVAIMRAELGEYLSQIPNLLQSAYGFVLPAGLFLILILALRHPRRLVLNGEDKRDYAAIHLLLAAILCAGIGVWFWLFGSGGVTQVRYLAPFALMSLVLVTPLLLRIIDRLKTAGTVVYRIVCIAPVLNMGLLLIQDNPLPAWQHLTGVNLSVRKSSSVVKQAHDLMDIARVENRSFQIYTLKHDIDDAVFTAVAGYRALIEASLPTFHMQRPIDWIRPTAIRIAEILQSDYVLFDPVFDSSSRNELLKQNPVLSFDAEFRLFAAWFTDLSIDKGIEIFADSPTYRLVRIVDRRKLKAGLDDLRRAHSWREAFINENLDTWWSKDQLAEFVRNRNISTTQIHFRDQFCIHAIAADWISGGVYVKLNVWWEKLQEPDGTPWLLKIDAVNDRGDALVSKQIELSQEKPENNYRTVRFDTLQFAVPRARGIHRIAIGICRYNPVDEQLDADAGSRDRDNHRVLIPIR